MIGIDMRMGLALLALVALTTPAAAEEQGSDWLGSVGDFVRAGLGPARTIEDIRRDEERAREAALQGEPAKAEPKVAHVAPVEPPPVSPVPGTPVAVTSVAPPVPVPQAAPVAKPAAVRPPMTPEARPQARPEPRPQVQSKANVTPVSVPAAVATAPVPVPLPEARPKAPAPVAARPTEQSAPELPASRIAATATVDQAIKLGGSSDTYSQRFGVSGKN